ncbi:MAG: glycoside hydrolase family 95 protein [Phycisphaerales bacterium]|nr:glycoside hydrolase family 95 protein [Phycisphaerales bacterium]
MQKLIWLPVLTMLACFAGLLGAYANDAAGSAVAASNSSNGVLPLELLAHTSAKRWMHNAYPIGNGRLGAMIFGRVADDLVQFNEDSLWTGGPGAWSKYDGGNIIGGAAHIKAVQMAIRDHKPLPLETLRKYFRGNMRAYGRYQAFGDITIKSQYPTGNVSGYSRTLSLNSALAHVHFNIGDVAFNRTYFCSYPDQVFIARYTASQPKALTMAIGFDSPHRHCTIQAVGNRLLLTGELSSNHMGFQAVLVVRLKGGSLKDVGRHIQVDGATTVTLMLSAATAYRDQYPSYTGNDFKIFNRTIIAKAAKQSYATLLADHEQDYRALFDRCRLNLAGSAAPGPQLTTRQEFEAFTNGVSDPHFDELIFQYGRYLLISSSRAGSLPANLQGVWNDSDHPPWTCDYHMDINLQMNYWPVEATNLSPCAVPLVDFVWALQQPGHVTAETVYGAGGWTCHTMVNAFGNTAPGWGLSWGLFPAAGAWICQPIWEHYAYTLNKTYLADQAYPILKGAAQFWVDHLVRDAHGRFVSSPCISPEWGPVSQGTACDQELIWNLFTHCIEASRILHKDKAFRAKLIAMLQQLAPLRIGKAGQLQEWRQDVDKPSAFRHLSPHVGLYAGSEISPLTTPKLAAAAKKLLIWRGPGSTGWSCAWRACCWAALLDGNKAYQMYRSQIRLVSKGGYLFPNLFDTCNGTFQVDGNFGATATITAMLLQSQTDIIQLLPALPSAWPSGQVQGLVAKNAITISESWSHGVGTQATLTPQYDAVIELAPPPGERIESIRTQKGKSSRWLYVSPGIIKAELAAHQTYVVTLAVAAHAVH